MPKKETPPENPNELNAVNLSFMQAFLLKFAKMNYEGKYINTEMLNTFTNFLQYLNENLLKKSESYTPEIIKAFIDISITVQFNLHMNEELMTSASDIEPVIKFLESLLNFVDKLFLFEEKGKNEKITEVMDLFWPLLANEKEIEKVEVKQFDKIALALEKLNNLPYIYEIEPYYGRISFESVMNESLEIAYMEQNLQFSTVFRSVLSKYNEKNRVFIESFLTYFQFIMNQKKDQKNLFQKCFNLLINISNCVGEKYNYIEIFFNRLISSSYPIRNFTYAFSSVDSQNGIEKYYSNQNLLTLSFIIVEKILNEKTINRESANALEIISKISSYWIDLSPNNLEINDFKQKLNINVVFKFIKFVTQIPTSQNISNSFNSASMIENSLLEAERALFESGELDSKKIYEFFKQCEMKNDSEEGGEWMDNSNRTAFGRIENSEKQEFHITSIKNFSTIIINLSRNKSLISQMRLNSIEQLEKLLNETFSKDTETENKENIVLIEISSLIIKCFPNLIPDDWNEVLLRKCFGSEEKVNKGEGNSVQNEKIIEIIQSLLIKKLEQTENYSKIKQDISFQEFINKIFTVEFNENQEVLNFHFLIFYILIKKCSSLPEKEEITELQSITQILISKLNNYLEEYPKVVDNKDDSKLENIKKSLLILEFFLVLILDHPSSSYKLSLKKIVTSEFPTKLSNVLDIYDLITINQKETANSFFSSKSKIILGFSEEIESQLCKNFLNLVEKLNEISFPENYLRLGNESKEEKKMKIFLNIKLNNICLSLRKSHKVPELIKNINLMRKTNSISSLEIILFSFCEFFEGLSVQVENNEVEVIPEEIEDEGQEKKTLELSESHFIVGFNYLLKINLLIAKFNETLNEEAETDLSSKIYVLQDLHSLIQETLTKIEQLILEQNQTFDLKTLIKIHQNIKESNHSIGGIAEKYNDLVAEGQMIRLISELTEDPQKLKMEFSQLALVTMKKLFMKDEKINQRIKELEKIKLEEAKNEVVNEIEEKDAIEEEKSASEMKDLSTKLKQLYLIYYPYKHDLNLGNLLKVKIEMSILQLLEDPEQSNYLTKPSIETLSNSIVEDLLKNISIVKEIIVKENQEASVENADELIWNFKYEGESKFISFIIKSILKMFTEKDKRNFQFSDKIFSISSEILDNQEICELAKKEIGKDLSQQFIAMVSGRVEEGCLMVKKKSESTSPRKSKKGSIENIEAENKQIKDFHTASTKLYNIVKKVINVESINGEEIVNSLISKDTFASIEVTKFLMTELTNISTFLTQKSDNLTETVFSYVIKANESYQVGKNQLQIPEFLCEFFNISRADNFKNQIQSLEKSERSTNACGSNIFYRCLKCDDKRIICYSCAVECHKGHPIIYLSEQRFPKCQCREIGIDKCQLAKKVEEGKVPKPEPFGNMFNYESGRPLKGNRHEFFMMEEDRMYDQLNVYEEDDFRDNYRFGGARIRKPREFEPMGRENNIFSIDPLDRGENSLGETLLVRHEKKIEASNEKLTEENFDFEDEKYEMKSSSMEAEDSNKMSSSSSIESQSYLLPVFLEMFNNIYSTSEEISSQKITSQNEKFSFNSLTVGKIMHNAWRASNAGSYMVRLRKENQLNNKSPAVSKQVIAQNNKFILVSSGSMIFVHPKERYFMNLLDGKQTQSLTNIFQYTGNFDIHTIDFSPLDESVIIISGLHNIIMLNINNDGLITKNSQHQRVNVNNDYINKVRTSSLGIFYSTSYEIKLLNWSFKQVLTIKSSADCLLKEWCLYEKSSGCTVYCVTAHGYTEYIDVAPSDEGKKVFTNKVVDGRKTIETGSSILVKDVEKIGKVYLASFKDKEGSNIIGNLQGDTVENTSNFLLRNNFVDHFKKSYLIGQSEIIKGSENEIYVICTIREPLTPENSIGQGQLTVFHVRKDKKCEFQLINTDNKCENFAVVPVGDSNWSIISIHDDGSLHFSILQKPHKQTIDQECKKLREIEPISQEKNIEKYSQLKQTIKKTITFDTLSEVELHPVNYFREFSENLKNNNDYKISKKNQEYEVTLINNNKLIAGFTLPFIGNVYFPYRTVKNTVQVGLSNLEALYYFVEGTLKFRVEKIEDYKTGMENLNQKFKEKYERLERLGELSMDSERAMQILNTIKQAESLGSDEVEFYGQSVDAFKSKISNFSEIFNDTTSETSKEKKLEKIAILLHIFISDSIKNENYLCEPYEILEFVKNLRKISLGVAKPEIYNILKNLIQASLKMYEAQMGISSHVFNDEFYPLKYATEEKANIFYEILKGEVNDNQVEESINFWEEICDEDLSLNLLYLSKYPSLLAKIHKKSKKIEKFEIKEKLLKLYVLGYQVLKFKDHNCDWILGGICSLFIGEQKNKGLREAFYRVLMKHSNVELPGWLKNVQEVDGEENVSNVNLVPKVSQPQVSTLIAEDNMAALYGQFDMGEMDEEAMIKMAMELSEIEMKRNEEINFGFNNASNVIEEEKDNIDDHMMMENEADQKENEEKRTLLKDLVEHCTKELNESSEIIAPKIIVLYVVSKYVNEVEDISTFNEILLKITKILGELTPSCDNIDKHTLMAYFSVFSNILSTSKILKNNLSETASDLYLVIKEEVIDRLENVKPEKVNKLKCPPNLLGRIFRGEKIYTFAHYAYGLVSLLLPPCEPLPILLSLECYWVLPQSKEFYTKMKHMTTIKEGISTGNIEKVYEVATKDPEVWRENADIVWLEDYIEDKDLNWEKALELLALYYENGKTPEE